MQVQSLLCLKSSWKKKRTIGWIFRICYQPVPGSNIMWVGQYKTKKKKKRARVDAFPSFERSDIWNKEPSYELPRTGRLTEAKYSQPAKSTAHIGWGHPGMTHSYTYRETWVHTHTHTQRERGGKSIQCLQLSQNTTFVRQNCRKRCNPVKLWVRAEWKWKKK